jgi:acyl dehydratase
VAVDPALARSLRARIGQATTEKLGRLDETVIRRYARAVGDSNPLHHDEQYARETGMPGLVAPPNLIPSIVCWAEGAGYDGLRADGTEAGKRLPGVPSSGVRIMGGGEEMEFHTPACADTELELETALTDVEERTSRSGPMLILRYRCHYTDQDGKPIITTYRTVLLR